MRISQSARVGIRPSSSITSFSPMNPFTRVGFSLGPDSVAGTLFSGVSDQRGYATTVATCLSAPLEPPIFVVTVALSGPVLFGVVVYCTVNDVAVAAVT